MFSRRLVVLGAVVVFSLANRPGWSQESQGTILGHITDSSDLVVPDAKVQVTNVATSVTLKTSTARFNSVESASTTVKPR